MTAGYGQRCMVKMTVRNQGKVAPQGNQGYVDEADRRDMKERDQITEILKGKPRTPKTKGI